MLDDLSLFNPTGVDVQPHDFEKFERQIEIKWEEERKHPAFFASVAIVLRIVR